MEEKLYRATANELSQVQSRHYSLESRIMEAFRDLNLEQKQSLFDKVMEYIKNMKG